MSLHEVCRTLANPRRYRLFEIVLQHRDLPLRDLIRKSGSPQSTVSNSLTRLVRSGLVVKERKGVHVYCRPVESEVVRCLHEIILRMARRNLRPGTLRRPGRR